MNPVVHKFGGVALAIAANFTAAEVGKGLADSAAARKAS
jgi:hypothetical protein